jgi:hypothetical protein
VVACLHNRRPFVDETAGHLLLGGIARQQVEIAADENEASERGGAMVELRSRWTRVLSAPLRKPAVP